MEGRGRERGGERERERERERADPTRSLVQHQRGLPPINRQEIGLKCVCVTKSRPAANRCFSPKNRCIELLHGTRACVRWFVSQFPLIPSSGSCSSPSQSSFVPPFHPTTLNPLPPSLPPSKNALDSRSIHPSIHPSSHPSNPPFLPLFSSPSAYVL